MAARSKNDIFIKKLSKNDDFHEHRPHDRTFVLLHMLIFFLKIVNEIHENFAKQMGARSAKS